LFCCKDRKLSNFGDSVGCASGNPGTLDARAAEIHPAGMLRTHGGPESDVVVQEVGSIDRLWSGKSKQFDAR